MTTQLQREAASEDVVRESAEGHIRVTDENAEGLKGIFKQLTQEHAEILRLLLTAETNDDLTQSETALRRAGELIEAHDHAETTVLYARLREQSKLAQLADAHEEDAGKLLRVLTQLRSLPSKHRDWRRTVHQLVAMLQQHMRVEEADDFPAAQRVLGAASDALLDAYVRERAAMLDRSPH
jgi:Hemerythrin HHE cation binding domain